MDSSMGAPVSGGDAASSGPLLPAVAAAEHALPELDPGGTATAQAADDALNRVLQRMRANGDFPALSQSVARIQRIAGSDTESVASLAGEILKDVALTHKLLRVVNTVHFRHVGGGVSTVSRAVALVGFAGIRNMALSLLLLEGLTDPQQADRLRDELVRSLLAAQLASALTPAHADAEEAYLAGLFHNLGPLLTAYYLPAEASAIDSLCRAGTAGVVPMQPDAAARQVLGLGFEALALGVARAWGLPEGLRTALRRPLGAVPQREVRAATERQRWLAALASDMAWAMQGADGAAARSHVRLLADQHARALGCSTADIVTAVDRARRALVDLASAMGLRVRPGTGPQRLMDFSCSGHAPAAATAHALPPPEPLASCSPVAGPHAVQPPPAGDMLAAGIQDVMSTLAGETFALNTVLRMVLETLFRALHLRRVVFCLRDPKTQQFTGRFGLGDGVEKLLPLFNINARAEAGVAVDLFSAVCIKGVDAVFADASEPGIRQRLPGWYGPALAAPSFLLLPLVNKGAAFGLIYADAAHAQALVLPERDMSLVRTLRSQAVMAFKQAA